MKWEDARKCPYKVIAAETGYQVWISGFVAYMGCTRALYAVLGDLVRAGL